MTDHPEMPASSSQSPVRSWGFWALIAGALAMILIFVQIAAPTLEPQPSAGQQIGEIAGEIKRSAWRTFFGLEKEAPKVEPEAPGMMDYLPMAIPILGVVALVLSAISGVLRENWRYAAYGTTLGTAAILFQFIWWVALLICAVVLLVSIIENIGDIFSFSLWD